MTEENSKKNQGKKNQFLLIKIMLLITLATFGYFAFKYWHVTKNDESKIAAEIAKTSDIADIFDFSDEYKSGPESYDLSDMTVNELKEKSAEFVYQILLKNQVQINDLKQQMQGLKDEFLKYKAHEKIGRIILAYVDLRQDFFNDKPYNESLKNLEILIFADEKMQSEIAKLKPLLNDFLTKEKLSKSFNNTIPQLIVDKNKSDNNSDFINKVRLYLAKLIIIRRIDGKVENDVDGMIVKIEKFLKEENYQEALVAALVLDQKYHTTLAEFLDKLNVAIEVRKIDQDILNHLKTFN